MAQIKHFHAALDLETAAKVKEKQKKYRLSNEQLLIDWYNIKE